MNRFLIEKNKLLLQTERHNKIVVESKIDDKKMLNLATDLLALAMNQKRATMIASTLIQLTRNERAVLDYLCKGVNKSEIAKRLKIANTSVYRIIRKINEKIDNCWQQNKISKFENKKKPNITYQEIYVQNIPFSAIQTLNDDGEMEEYEFGDENEAVDKMYRQLDLSTKLEETLAYQALSANPKQQKLAILLADGLTHKECAIRLGVSEQAVHQMVARMRRVLRNAKIVRA